MGCMFSHSAWKIKGPILAWALLVGGALGLRFALAWGDTHFLITHLFPDDAYYYFKIAENIVRGAGSTFDGAHLTNGYHPLWMAVCVGVYKVFAYLPTGQDLPIHVLLMISAVFDVLTAGVLWLFLRRLEVRPSLRFFICAAYLYNPWVIAHGLNGLESALANLLLMLTALLAMEVTGGASKKSKIVLYSLASALTILARIDYALFVGLLGLYLLWKIRATWKWREYLLTFLPGGIVLGVWMAWSAAYFGSVIPQSGLAYTFVQQTLFFYKPRSIITVLIWSVYQWFRAVSFAALVSGLSWFLWAIIASSLFFFGKKRYERKAFSGAEGILIVLMVGFIAYTFLQGAVRWSGREWYFSLGPSLACLGLGWMLQRQAVKQSVLVGIGVLCVALFGMTNPLMHERFANQGAMYEAAIQLPNFLSGSSTRVSSYNAGIEGYYAAQPIVNLDGLVNIEAYHALKERRMKAYLAEQGITHILDYDITVNYRYAPFWGTNDLSFLHPVHVFQENSSYNGSRLVLFEIR